ncbi:AAA family ATPase [Shinella zoogloeoides]|uniref:AAA family ATPase n=1 Tax=Shinella zoogloeoides TaxID=352475 RepID=UPI0028ADCAA5|nr:AAA family ATPase [Shinella zoogloeoides]
MTASTRTQHNSLTPQSVARAIGGKVVRGNRVVAHAPGHKKGAPEISITVDPSAPRGILVNCFSGEDPVAIKDWVLRQCGEPDFAPNPRSDEPTAHMGILKSKDTPKPFYDAHLIRQGYSCTAEYDYTTPDGEILFQVLRYEHAVEPKTFLQRQPDGNGGWHSGRGSPVLYRLHELAENVDDPVFIVEGEKDADRLASFGYLATTVPNGSWPDDVSVLAGRKVFVLADNDDAGDKKAEAAVVRLQGTAIVKRVDLPGLPPKGDVSNWLDAGHSTEELEALSLAAAPIAANDNKPTPTIISSAELVSGFIPPDYFIDGVAQKGFVYSMTGATGTGKTAVLLLIARLAAEGGELAGRGIEKGRVVYLAGENPDDVTMRWIGMAHETGFDVYEIDVHFIRDRFSVPDALAAIHGQVDALGGADLIVVDTSAAFFQGTDENGNTELGKHARDLRMLTTLPGRPCVIVACHPTKNATSDNLLPRGGGAFIAEVDGNLTLAKSDGSVKLHWQGKHRGPDFEPITLELKTITAPSLVDSKGRPIPTVMAQALSASDARGMAAAARRDEDDALLQIEANPKVSLTSLADALGWKRPDGSAHKDRARRATEKLRRDKLASYEGRRWKVTPAGFDALGDIRAERHREQQAGEFVSRAREKSAVRNRPWGAHEPEED